MTHSGTTEFDGLADGYQRHRPSYPSEIINLIKEAALRSGDEGHLIDLGAGTGILTRLLRDAFPTDWRFTAMEPGADMRRVAAEANAGDARIDVVDGAAEEIAAEPATINVITAAQALHWFNRPRFYREAGRVLIPGGCLAIIYNERDNTAPLLAEFEDGLEAVSVGYSRDYRNFPYVREMSDLLWASKVDTHSHHWKWELTPREFAGLMMSRSKTKPWVDHLSGDTLKDHLIAMAERHAMKNGNVALPYRTDLALAVKG